jgi:NAD(P)H-dependent flavin oxidoreductase YrpB (nitropropane dioxygenase family)
MRTRLTDLLEIEHPVMLAGMGGVSYHVSQPERWPPPR